jgi:short-subunit dehydrogenase
VLGGSGVLGGLIAAELHRQGARLVLAGRDAERLHERASAISAETQSVLFDLDEPTHADHVVKTAAEMLGGLDGIVNAAGVVAFGGHDTLSDSALDELFSVDLVGPLRVARSALQHIEQGFLVNITGVVAEQPMAGMAAYSAAKAGLSAATQALGRELRRRGILVLDARPPHTETGLATRPISGSAPNMPTGLDPKFVAETIVSGLMAGQRELPSSAFAA